MNDALPMQHEETTSLTEDELDGVIGAVITVGYPSNAMTATLCWGPGVGLFVWANGSSHGFVVST